VTDEEMKEAVVEARRKAHVAARCLFGPGMTGQTSVVVNATRLECVETLLIRMIATESEYNGTYEQKVLLEMRDYWELVATTIGEAGSREKDKTS